VNTINISLVSGTHQIAIKAKQKGLETRNRGDERQPGTLHRFSTVALNQRCNPVKAQAFRR